MASAVPIVSIAVESPDDAQIALATAARLVGNVIGEAKADGSLVAWSAAGERRQELDRRGVMTTLAPAVCARLLQDADNLRIPGSMDGLTWASLEHGAETAMAAGILQVATGRFTAVVALNRPVAPTLSRIRRALAHVAPIVSDYLRQASELRAATARARGLAAVMDAVDVGVALLDGDGRPAFMNVALQRLLDRRDGLLLNDRGLATSQLAETIRLQTAITHVLVGGEGAAPVVSIRRVGSARALLVSITPPSSPGPHHAATLQVFDPELELQPLLDPVCRLYHLTPVESRLTNLLANGRSLAEAAGVMRVREQTARSYLKQIFQKTDTKRQAELVWLMLKSGVRSARACPVRYF